jgi:hypothetical protein
MKIASLIARILLGLMFTIFGLNGFLHFIKAPLPTGLAGQFVTVLFVSKYYVLIFFVQLLAGVLFLVNRYVPLAIVLIGPVIVNILAFHITMDPGHMPMALVVTILWVIVAVDKRRHLAGIFDQRSDRRPVYASEQNR